MGRYDYDDDYGDYLYEKARDRQLDQEWEEYQRGQALIAAGWTAVSVTDETDIDFDYSWWRKNIEGEYRILNKNVYFQRREDAVLFEMTWCHNAA